MAAYDFPERWNGGVGEVTPYGLFAELACAPPALARPQHLLARRPWQCIGPGPPLSEAALEEGRVRRSLAPAAVTVSAQARAYQRGPHPHVPVALLKAHLQEDADAAARRARYDPYAGNRLAVCDSVSAAYASLDGSRERLSACELEGEVVSSWRHAATLDSAIEQLAFGSARVHGSPLVVARTMFSIHVLRAAASAGACAGGRAGLLPVYSVRCPSRPVDVVPSPYSSGELALALDSGAVLTLALDSNRGGGASGGGGASACGLGGGGGGGEAPLPQPTACVSLRSSASSAGARDTQQHWHALRYGHHPRTLWRADALGVCRVDTRAPPLGGCETIVRARSSGGGSVAHGGVLELGLDASDRIHALSVAPDGGSAAGASQPLLGIASAAELFLVDVRFLKAPVLWWRPPEMVVAPELRAPPFLHFAPEPRAMLRCERESAHALCFPATPRAGSVPAAAPLPRSVLVQPRRAGASPGGASGIAARAGCDDDAADGSEGSWRQIGLPICGSTLRALPACRAAPAASGGEGARESGDSHALLTLDANGRIWALRLHAAGEEGAGAEDKGAARRGQRPRWRPPVSARTADGGIMEENEERAEAAGASGACAGAMRLRWFDSATQLRAVRDVVISDARSAAEEAASADGGLGGGDGADMETQQEQREEAAARGGGRDGAREAADLVLLPRRSSGIRGAGGGAGDAGVAGSRLPAWQQALVDKWHAGDDELLARAPQPPAPLPLRTPRQPSRQTPPEARAERLGDAAGAQRGAGAVAMNGGFGNGSRPDPRVGGRSGAPRESGGGGARPSAGRVRPADPIEAAEGRAAKPAVPGRLGSSAAGAPMPKRTRPD